MHYKLIQEGQMCNLVFEKDLNLPQVVPFIVTAPNGNVKKFPKALNV
jgi:hypothetical protein